MGTDGLGDHWRIVDINTAYADHHPGCLQPGDKEGRVRVREVETERRREG